MASALRHPCPRFHAPVAMCLALLAAPILAQNIPQSHPAATIGTLQNPDSSSNSPAQVVRVAGAITLEGSMIRLGNGSTVTAGLQTVAVQLTRGGTLDLCATTQVRLSQSQATADANGALMMSLDRGALEEHATLGKDSDVILTPDLRILISGPGTADVQLRVNAKGDTCLENHVAAAGDIAPYVTVSEQLSDGVYRVQPNQRVLFEHGSLRDVVDNEPEPCGCPAAALSVASAGTTASPAAAAALGQAVEVNPDTAFPLAESEGLAPPPSAPTQPVVAPGQTHVEVATTLTYDSNHPEAKQNFADEAAAFGSKIHTSGNSTVTSGDVQKPAGEQPRALAHTPPTPRPKPVGLFRHIGRFFKQIFG